MHQLILLRHAKAVPEGKAPDHARALADIGRAAATAIGQAMKKAGLAPEVVLVSTAARTQGTLEQLEAAGVWEEWPNIDAMPALYMASAAQIRDILRGLPETVRSAMVIGHNPGLHECALSLAGPRSLSGPSGKQLEDGFPTAALAEFLVTTPWRRLGAGNATLQRLVVPKDLI
jgi:phosphohistidine phosphatase